MTDDERIDGILPYLEVFTQPGFHFGGWTDPPPMVGMNYILSEPCLEFYRDLYEYGWVVNADWSAWREETRRYMEQPQQLATADVATITRLLTTHVRGDRFCEGHLGQMLESGHITAILRRLQAIRAARVRTDD